MRDRADLERPNPALRTASSEHDSQWSLWPIGTARTPFLDKASAPRQPSEAKGVEGRIELVSGRGLEFAVEGLDSFSHVWLLFGFHLTEGHWRPKVRPPRSDRKRGVLATRSPHRPNGLGMSVVRLERVNGLTLHVRDVDLVDGTPVFDVKPYLPYCDAIVEASSGWLESPRVPSLPGLQAGESFTSSEAPSHPAHAAPPRDPGLRFEVRWSELAEDQARFIAAQTGIDVRPGVETILAAGPEPHPYRRIRRLEKGRSRLAHKAWRYEFSVSSSRVEIDAITSGYRPSELEASDLPEVRFHRDFAERFGSDPRKVREVDDKREARGPVDETSKPERERPA